MGNAAIGRVARTFGQKAIGTAAGALLFQPVRVTTTAATAAAARGVVRYMVSSQAMGSGSPLGRVPVEAMRSSMEVL